MEQAAEQFAGLGIVLVTVVIGILFNQAGLNRLSDKVDGRFDKADARMDRMEARLDRMQADLSTFYRILGKHDKGIELLEKRTGS